ncbi:MAG: hypothetical protein WEB89_00660 [Balneolales bacterium]
MNRLITLITLLFTIGYILTGCDTTNTGLDDAGTVQLQMAVNTSNSTAKQLQASQNQEGLVIEEVQLFISEMELESVENDSLDFEIENFIVNLPLDGSPLILSDREVPAGMYDEFELEIEKPDDEDVVVNNSDFQDETGEYSVVVKGLYNGEEFMFRSSEDFELEIDLNPLLVIEDGGSSVLVISIGVDSWFRGSEGQDLDPKDPANTEQINENIERSFEAFEDDDDDDDDDE